MAVAVRVEGNVEKIHALELTTRGGEMIESRPVEMGGGGFLVLGRVSDRPLPEGTRARIVIPIDPVEFQVPFSFTDIALP